MGEGGEATMIRLLAGVGLFEGLDEQVLELLAARSRVETHAAGEVVFLEGEIAAGLYVVEEGWVRVVRSSAEGREQVLQFVGPGEAFNPVGAFSPRPNPATAIALEACRVLVIPREGLKAVAGASAEFALRVMENMAERMAYLVGLAADLSLRPVTARFARLLLDAAQDGILVRQRWLTMAEIAARLGTVPDVIQRVVGRLQAEGVIEVSRKEIRLKDLARLQELAE